MNIAKLLILVFSLSLFSIANANEETEELSRLIQELEQQQTTVNFPNSSSYVFVDEKKVEKKEASKEGLTIVTESMEVKNQKRLEELVEQAEKRQYDLRQEVRELQKKMDLRSRDVASLNVSLGSQFKNQENQFFLSDATLFVDKVPLPKFFFKINEVQPFTLLRGAVPLGKYTMTAQVILVRNNLTDTKKSERESIVLKKEFEIILDKTLQEKNISLTVESDVSGPNLKVNMTDVEQKRKK